MRAAPPPPPVEWGVATFVLPGQIASGDHHVICHHRDGVLVAAIDGIGHGQEAAIAAQTARAVLERHAQESIISVVEHCHDALRSTRGIVLSLASIDIARGRMTWLGIGNILGVLMRAGAIQSAGPEMLLLRAGVVGAQLPPLRAAVLAIGDGDTLLFATDGVRHEFIQSLTARENPQRAADRILEQYHSGRDDALVLVVRLTGPRAGGAPQNR